MADSPEQNATAEDAQSAPPNAKGLKSLLMTVGGIAAGVIIGASVGLFILGPRLAPANAATVSHGAKSADSKKEETDEHGAKKGEPSPMYQIDNLVLNPAGSGGSRFLLVSVALEARDEATIAQLKGHDAEMRDAVLRMFGSKTVEQVSEATSRDALRKELLAVLQQIAPGGMIKKLYFPQFVIQ